LVDLPSGQLQASNATSCSAAPYRFVSQDFETERAENDSAPAKRGAAGVASCKRFHSEVDLRRQLDQPGVAGGKYPAEIGRIDVRSCPARIELRVVPQVVKLEAQLKAGPLGNGRVL